MEFKEIMVIVMKQLNAQLLKQRLYGSADPEAALPVQGRPLVVYGEPKLSLWGGLTCSIYDSRSMYRFNGTDQRLDRLLGY